MTERYRWFVPGDINGFFGLMVDNMTVMSFVAGILIGIFGFPAEIVYTKMFPGTAFGVLFGDLVYTWMAFDLAKRTGRQDITAMPLGLDTPSSIGVAFAVLGPAFVELKSAGMSPNDAAMMTWYIGMATMINIGIIKLVFSFFGGFLQRIIPQAGLLGSLAGIGLLLIGTIPMLDIFKMPIVGLVSLGLILYTLVAGIRLPGNAPGVLVAVVVGTILFYALDAVGLSGATHREVPHYAFAVNPPVPTLLFMNGYVASLKYLPVAVPFAILTVIGGINVTESARVGGDNYNTRNILLTEAVATLVAGICGGVAQSTPYIGQPAYKAMGSRAGYTVLTGLFVGLGGIFGYVSFFLQLIPTAVLAPILIFVALDIVAQAFQACPARHAPAVTMSMIPTVTRLLAIKLMGTQGFADSLKAAPKEEGLPENLVIVALGNGFIVTGMLWGGFMAELVDRRLIRSCIYLLILAALTFVGIIHSALPDGNMYWPLNLTVPVQKSVPILFTLGYLALAVLIAALSFTPESKEPPPEGGGHGGHFAPPPEILHEPSSTEFHERKEADRHE